MSAEALDALLTTLRGGDPAAAERALRAYEPQLRLVVRRQLSRRLRAKFDSADVVQSVWLHVLRGCRDGRWQIRSAGHLRALLVPPHPPPPPAHAPPPPPPARPPREREAPPPRRDQAPPSRQPRPSEVAQAGDLWERLLALCPPEHHEVLRLKRQGLALAEIAART